MIKINISHTLSKLVDFFCEYDCYRGSRSQLIILKIIMSCNLVKGNFKFQVS